VARQVLAKKGIGYMHDMKRKIKEKLFTDDTKQFLDEYAQPTALQSYVNAEDHKAAKDLLERVLSTDELPEMKRVAEFKKLIQVTLNKN